MAPFQSSGFVRGLSASSTGHSGAAAIAAAICSGLKNCLEIALGFMTVTVSARNQMRSGFPIRPDQRHDAAVQPTQAFQPLFAVGFPVILIRHQRRIKNRRAIREVDFMFAQVDLALGVIEGDHK